MSQVDKFKAAPRGWTYETQRRVEWRLVGAVVIALVLVANTWMFWQERDRLAHRLDQLEIASRASIPLPPEGFDIVP